MAELEYIRWIRQQTQQHPRVMLPAGDDCAVVSWPRNKPLLVTTDMLLEGSCFLRNAGPDRIGRKAMSVNLSDIAAMAGKPIAAVVSLGLPRDLPQSWAETFFVSLQSQAAAYDVVIVGGDTNSWNGPISINVTLFGEPTGSGPVTRSGARPGDALLVTGQLGGSILGHHLDFHPRVQEAQQLHQLITLHAMIDISDGLAADLHHLCQESECGAEVWAETIPVSNDALTMNDEKTPLQHALGDGEDFELLFACNEDDAEQVIRTQPFSFQGVNLSKIGRFTTEKVVSLVHKGKRQALPALGYEHSFGKE